MVKTVIAVSLEFGLCVIFIYLNITILSFLLIQGHLELQL